MSEQPKRQHNGAPDPAHPGKRLEKRGNPALTPGQAQKRKEKRIMAVMIALAAVMTAAAALVLLYNRWVKRPELPGPNASLTSPPDESAEPTLDIDAIEPKVGGERRSKAIYTVLIFGSDETSGLTDTMMVATYDVTNQRATVMSLPRDTLINSSARPNINAKKLNAVYNVYGQGDKGIEALKNEVSELVGFVPDYYVQIDWALVGEMVDAIGGVWFDNPYHMQYYDPAQDLDIYQPQGYRLLWGSDAMQVVRWRHNDPGIPYNPGVSKAYAASDLERLAVQHAFLKAVLKQTLQIGNITRIGQIIQLFNSRVNSDLAVENMLWFGQEAVLGGLKVDDVEFCTMPNAGGSYRQPGYRDPFTFVCPRQGELLTLINEKLNPFVEEVTIRQLDLMSQNADGSLRSSTGRLAAPELGNPPARETPKPEETGPVETGPAESGGPQGSAPVTSEPPPGGPEDSPPPSEPIPTAPGGDPQPQQTQAGGGEPADWGDTPD